MGPRVTRRKTQRRAVAWPAPAARHRVSASPSPPRQALGCKNRTSLLLPLTVTPGYPGHREIRDTPSRTIHAGGARAWSWGGDTEPVGSQVLRGSVQRVHVGGEPGKAGGGGERGRVGAPCPLFASVAPDGSPGPRSPVPVAQPAGPSSAAAHLLGSETGRRREVHTGFRCRDARKMRTTPFITLDGGSVLK